MFTPTKIVLETKNLAFGLKPPMTVNFELQMFEDVVGPDPSYIVQAPKPVPFSYSITNNTLRPTLTLTLDHPPSEFELGKEYELSINNPDNKLIIMFLYGEDYQPLNWRMSDPETTAGHSYHFKEIEHGTKILTKDINTKLKMIFESLSNMSFKISDFLGKMETNRRLPDIIDCAIAGAYPKDCETEVIRETDGRISTVNLRYKRGSERFTRITYFYVDHNVSYDFQTPTIPNCTKIKPLLHRIEIDRVASEEANAQRRYNLCTVQFYRQDMTIPSTFGGTITMPMINRWDVIE